MRWLQMLLIQTQMDLGEPNPQRKEGSLGFLRMIGKKNGQMVVSGRICLYVACYDFVLGFNVSSSPLMFFQVGFWG